MKSKEKNAESKKLLYNARIIFESCNLTNKTPIIVEKTQKDPIIKGYNIKTLLESSLKINSSTIAAIIVTQ
jgi:hypothetical protein